VGGWLSTESPYPVPFYDRPVLDVAPELLGATIWHGPVAVRITEVEAYGGADDPASHAFRGLTPRNAVMFGQPGSVYVYLSYGVHWCLNIVCSPAGQAAAVLVRSGKVIAGLDGLRARWPRLAERDLARGPGRLGRVLSVGPDLNGTPVTGGGPLRVTGVPTPGAQAAVDAQPTTYLAWQRSTHGRGSARIVQTGPRVGIRLAAERPWRFWLAEEPSVSRGPARSVPHPHEG
jgi:DNA-3-methyladenine glycosylase